MQVRAPTLLAVIEVIITTTSEENWEAAINTNAALKHPAPYTYY